MTPVSWPPTISRVGARTAPSIAPARSGRPPRETTAPTSSGRCAAAHRAAAAPVLAPNSPSGRARKCGSAFAQSMAARQAVAEQLDVEDIVAVGFLLPGQQIEQQRGDAMGVEGARHRDIARAEPARAAAMGEQHDRRRPGRHGKVAGHSGRADANVAHVKG